MPLYLVAKSTQPVVSLDDMKKHLRVDHSFDDDLIEAMTAAATQHIDGRDGWLGRALVAQTWDYALAGFCWWPTNGGYDRRYHNIIQIPLPPLIEVESIKYYDGDDVQQTIDVATYDVVGAGDRGFVALKNNQSWPSTYCRPEPVTIRFRAGYVDTADSPPSGEVPAPIVAAIKLMTGTLYENRESVIVGSSISAVTMPWAAEQLLGPLRVF
jgi:uncharacterized phiE125 gp8 family phage protein